MKSTELTLILLAEYTKAGLYKTIRYYEMTNSKYKRHTFVLLSSVRETWHDRSWMLNSDLLDCWNTLIFTNIPCGRMDFTFCSFNSSINRRVLIFWRNKTVCHDTPCRKMGSPTLKALSDSPCCYYVRDSLGFSWYSYALLFVVNLSSLLAFNEWEIETVVFILAQIYWNDQFNNCSTKNYSILTI